MKEKETGVTVKMRSVQVVMPRKPQRRRCSKGEHGEGKVHDLPWRPLLVCQHYS